MEWSNPRLLSVSHSTSHLSPSLLLPHLSPGSLSCRLATAPLPNPTLPPDPSSPSLFCATIPPYSEIDVASSASGMTARQSQVRRTGKGETLVTKSCLEICGWGWEVYMSDWRE